MSRSFYVSDLHEGHRNIGKFRSIPKKFLDMAGGDSTKANSLWIDDEWRKARINKRDTVYCLGDNAFTEWGIDQIGARLGKKIAFGGNHDDLPITSYMRAFNNIRGCKKDRTGAWLSHFPVHPSELRGKFSVHGHVHYQTIDDWRYINVCCDSLYEATGQMFLSRDSLLKTMDYRRIHHNTEIIV